MLPTSRVSVTRAAGSRGSLAYAADKLLTLQARSTAAMAESNFGAAGDSDAGKASLDGDPRTAATAEEAPTVKVYLDHNGDTEHYEMPSLVTAEIYYPSQYAESADAGVPLPVWLLATFKEFRDLAFSLKGCVIEIVVPTGYTPHPLHEAKGTGHRVQIKRFGQGGQEAPGKDPHGIRPVRGRTFRWELRRERGLVGNVEVEDKGLFTLHHARVGDRLVFRLYAYANRDIQFPSDQLPLTDVDERMRARVCELRKLKDTADLDAEKRVRLVTTESIVRKVGWRTALPNADGGELDVPAPAVNADPVIAVAENHYKALGVALRKCVALGLGLRPAGYAVPQSWNKNRKTLAARVRQASEANAAEVNRFSAGKLDACIYGRQYPSRPCFKRLCEIFEKYALYDKPKASVAHPSEEQKAAFEGLKVSQRDALAAFMREYDAAIPMEPR